MKTSMLRTLLPSAIAILMLFAGQAQATRPAPPNDPQLQKLLLAMSHGGTWYHPDLEAEFSGVHAYMHGHFEAAAKFFRKGALYADKLSQLCLGLMYLNGEGVAKDPVTAYAWLELAAERNYPDYVATRDSVKAGLSPQQLERAAAIFDQLRVKYADAAAKPRLIKQFRQGQMQLTGSRTGFDFGVGSPPPTYGGKGIGLDLDPCTGYPAVVLGPGLVNPPSGCGGSYLTSRARWDPDKYFASRDALWEAVVTVGDIQQSDKHKAPAH